MLADELVLFLDWFSRLFEFLWFRCLIDFLKTFGIISSVWLSMESATWWLATNEISDSDIFWVFQQANLFRYRVPNWFFRFFDFDLNFLKNFEIISSVRLSEESATWWLATNEISDSDIFWVSQHANLFCSVIKFLTGSLDSSILTLAPFLEDLRNHFKCLVVRRNCDLLQIRPFQTYGISDSDRFWVFQQANLFFSVIKFLTG